MDSASSKAVSDVILARYACKSFQDKKVSPLVIEKLLSLSSRAPSSWNTQPYVCIVVESESDKERLAQAMDGPNPEIVRQSCFSLVWAADPDPKLPPDVPDFAASVLKEVSLKQQSTHEAWAVKQTMLAVGFFLIAATAHGLETNPMEGFRSQAAVREAVGLPDKYDVPVVVAVGFAKDPRPAASNRRPLFKTFFWNRFGQSFNARL
eukprot:Skav211146  [mRNA]  locus=C8883024:7:739:+ [translate_table: standard]